MLLKSDFYGNKFLNVFKVIFLVKNRLNENNKIRKPNYRSDTIKLMWLIIYKLCTIHILKNLGRDTIHKYILKNKHTRQAYNENVT